ncbi:hypothetical protein B9Z55_028026 [Caenorhabditis nigoni]|nr:hypothetical protein B9Z55_028026 [Caenorhabditis nigoni]
MTPEEQSAVIERSAARPHERIQTTENVADAVGLLRITDPIVVPGIVLKALIVNHCGRFYDAMQLKNWGIVFLSYQTVRDVAHVLYEELH